MKRSLTNRDQVFARPEEERSIAQRRRGHAGFTELVGCSHREGVGGWKDIDVAHFTREEEVAAVGYRGSSESFTAVAQAFAESDGAALRVEASDHTEIDTTINIIADDNRRL